MLQRCDSRQHRFLFGYTFVYFTKDLALHTQPWPSYHLLNPTACFCSNRVQLSAALLPGKQLPSWDTRKVGFFHHSYKVTQILESQRMISITLDTNLACLWIIYTRVGICCIYNAYRLCMSSGYLWTGICENIIHNVACVVMSRLNRNWHRDKINLLYVPFNVLGEN